MIWRVRRHIAVQIQRFCQCSNTKDHISSTSRISSGWAGSRVSSSFGFCWSFFEPTCQRIATDAKSTLDATHTGTFVGIGRNNLIFLLGTITVFRFQDTALATVFAPELLVATRIVAVLDNILASAVSTTVHDCFCDHMPRLSHFTYLEPRPCQVTSEILYNKFYCIRYTESLSVCRSVQGIGNNRICGIHDLGILVMIFLNQFDWHLFRVLC